MPKGNRVSVQAHTQGQLSPPCRSLIPFPACRNTESKSTGHSGASVGSGRGGEPRSPGEALTAQQTQPGSAGPHASHPPPDLPLTHSLASHKPLQHPNAVAPFKAFLSTVRPQRRLRGFREITFFSPLPLSSLLRDIFNAFIILKGLLECEVQDDTFRSRYSSLLNPTPSFPILYQPPHTWLPGAFVGTLASRTALPQEGSSLSNGCVGKGTPVLNQTG